VFCGTILGCRRIDTSSIVFTIAKPEGECLQPIACKPIDTAYTRVSVTQRTNGTAPAEKRAWR
jgi:hypothetical protein